MIAKQDSKPIDKIDVKRRKCTISEEMQKLMLRQLVHEMYNHNLYNTFANFYSVRGLNILAEYYQKRAEEEKLHHDWVYNYLLETDTEFIYPDIPAISEKFEELIDPLKLTVDKEIQTTMEIHEMVDLACDTSDWATFNWLNGHDKVKGMLVDEQVEEESISRTALDIGMQEGSWLRKEKSIMNAYTGDLD